MAKKDKTIEDKAIEEILNSMNEEQRAGFKEAEDSANEHLHWLSMSPESLIEGGF